MIYIEVRRSQPPAAVTQDVHGAACPPERKTWKRVAIGMVAVLTLVLLWVLWGTAGAVRAQVPPGFRVHLPVLSIVGTEATTQTLIQVQNVGSEFTQVAMLVWGEAGACSPQAVGPFKLECSGILKPGATWIFADAQVPAGAQSAILYSFPVDEIIVDGQKENIGNLFCEILFRDVVFDADEFRRFDLAFRQGLPYQGLPTTGGQPIAVDVVRLGQGDPSPELLVSGSYSGFTTAEEGNPDPVFGGFAYYVPVVYADAQGLNSWLYIQNVGIDCTTVEMWFQEQEDCLDATICEIFTLAPGETVPFDVNECVGPSFVGSVWLRTSQPIGVVVDHIGQDILMTDKGLPANNAITNAGSQVLFGPLIYREFQGWQSSITVQNLSGVRAATVKVYFYDESGNVITTLVDWICPRGSQTFFLPVINGLPGRFVGAVRVESLTTFTPGGPVQEFVPIAGVAHLVRYSDPTAAVPLEAVSYNLFPEPQAFDYQLGPGITGLIGIPSVLKNKAGLSTEIAIQNVNPNPGFTDFAIYLYDANGLIDVICEKLGSLNVEYLNVNNWGVLNPGFGGSAVISALFTTQDGGFGLTAVAIERVGTLLQFDVPGDESSGHEAFPISGDFEFEGPSAPNCPGVFEQVCQRTIIVQVTSDGTAAGTPVANALVMLKSGAFPVATGTTDSNGIAVLTVPVPNPGTTSYDIWVQPQGGTLQDTGVDTGALDCPADPLTVIAPPGPPTYNIAGTVFNDGDGDCTVEAGEGQIGNVIIVLMDPGPDGAIGGGDDSAVAQVVTGAGGYRFEDIPEGRYYLLAGLGAAVYPSDPFDLNADYDGSITDSSGNPELPNFITDGSAGGGDERWAEPGCDAVNGPVNP